VLEHAMGLTASFALLIAGRSDFAIRCLETLHISLGCGIFRVVMKPLRIKTRFSPNLAGRFFEFSYLFPPPKPLSSCSVAGGGGLPFHLFAQVRPLVSAA